jgi:hypothetical protein
MLVKAKLDLIVVAHCDLCNQDVEGGAEYHGLPQHNDATGEMCPNSGYSPAGVSYRVDSVEQALALAEAIIADTTVCLSGRGFHTIGCGDGRECAEERLLWAKALANFILANPPQ